MRIEIRTFFRPPFQQMQQRFKAAREKMKAQQRESMRDLGRLLVSLLQKEAPKGKTGKFAKGHTYKTFEKGETIEMRAYIPQPLGRWIIFGTKPHVIAAKNKKALAFFWPKAGMQTFVPKRGGFRTHVSDGALWIGKGYVNHPGTKPNPYQERAMRAFRPRAVVELKKMSRAFVMGLKD